MPDPLKTNWKPGDQFTPGDANTHAAAINAARNDAEAAIDAAAELSEGLSSAVTAELDSRYPQIIADPDNPTTHIRWKWGDAISPPMPGTATTMDLIGDATALGRALARSANQAAARNALDARSVVQQGVPGRIVLMLDDGLPSHVWAMSEAEKRGQVLNLALVTDLVGGSYMNSSQIRAARMRGHGFTMHSKSHPNMTTLSDTDLVDQFTSPRGFFSTLVGADPTQFDFVYPQSARDARTISAGYLRYRRQFAGRFGSEPWRTKWYRPKPNLCGRFNWDSSRHQLVKDEISAAAASNEDIVIYTHAVDGTASNGVTNGEFTDMLDHALRIGMRLISVDEFNKPNAQLFGSRPNGLVDASFEAPGVATADLQAYFDANFLIVSGSTGTATIVDTSAATGVPGSRALKLTRTGTAAGSLIVQQRIPILSAPWIEQGSSVVFAGRLKTALTTINTGGGADIRVVCAASDGTADSGASGRAQASQRYTGTDWSAAGEVKTAELVNITGHTHLTVQWRLVNVLGESLFDHSMLSFGLNDSAA